MTPERFKHIKEFRLMYGEVSCTATAELIEEIERLQVELDEMKKHLDLALPQAAGSCLLEKELEQAKERIRELEAENVLLRKAFDGAMHPHTFTTGSTEIKDHS